MYINITMFCIIIPHVNNTHMHSHTHVHAHIHTHTHICTQLQTYIHAHMHLYTHMVQYHNIVMIKQIQISLIDSNVL